MCVHTSQRSWLWKSKRTLFGKLTLFTSQKPHSDHNRYGWCAFQTFSYCFRSLYLVFVFRVFFFFLPWCLMHAFTFIFKTHIHKLLLICSTCLNRANPCPTLPFARSLTISVVSRFPFYTSHSLAQSFKSKYETSIMHENIKQSLHICLHFAYSPQMHVGSISIEKEREKRFRYIQHMCVCVH